MTTIDTSFNKTSESPARGSGLRTDQTRGQRVIRLLIVAGFTASVITVLSFREATLAQVKSDQLAPGNIVKSQVYYASHALEIALLLGAGLLSLLSLNSRTIRTGYRFRFVLLLGAALFMARTYTAADFVSTKLVDATGPVPFLLSLLIFVGTRKDNWRFLDKLIAAVSVPFSALALLGIAELQSFSRIEGVQRLGIILNDLFWPASWIALRPYAQSSWWRYLRFVPIAIYAFGSFFTQTRLNVVMILALIGIYSFIQYRRRMPQTAGWTKAIFIVAWASLFIVIFLGNSRVVEKLDSVATAFSSRLDEDTRTGQVVSFFEDVQPQELILGRGSLATWYWGIDYSGGTDVGYLTLLFYGGLPLLITYCLTHLAPCFDILRCKSVDWRLTAAGVVFLWCLRLCSSDYPSIAIGNYVILFCVGACISKDDLGQIREHGRLN